MTRCQSKGDLNKFLVKGSTGPAGKTVVSPGGDFRGRSEADPVTYNGVIALHLISAIRALGSLCAEVGDMLDSQSRTGSSAPQGQPPPRGWCEVRGVSLDPSTFVDDEDEQGNAA